MHEHFLIPLEICNPVSTSPAWCGQRGGGGGDIGGVDYIVGGGVERRAEVSDIIGIHYTVPYLIGSFPLCLSAIPTKTLENIGEGYTSSFHAQTLQWVASPPIRRALRQSGVT